MALFRNVLGTIDRTHWLRILLLQFGGVFLIATGFVVDGAAQRTCSLWESFPANDPRASITLEGASPRQCYVPFDDWAKIATFQHGGKQTRALHAIRMAVPQSQDEFDRLLDVANNMPYSTTVRVIAYGSLRSALTTFPPTTNDLDKVMVAMRKAPKNDQAMFAALDFLLSARTDPDPQLVRIVRERIRHAILQRNWRALDEIARRASQLEAGAVSADPHLIQTLQSAILAAATIDSPTLQSDTAAAAAALDPIGTLKWALSPTILMDRHMAASSKAQILAAVISRQSSFTASTWQSVQQALVVDQGATLIANVDGNRTLLAELDKLVTVPANAAPARTLKIQMLSTYVRFSETSGRESIEGGLQDLSRTMAAAQGRAALAQFSILQLHEISTALNGVTAWVLRHEDPYGRYYSETKAFDFEATRLQQANDFRLFEYAIAFLVATIAIIIVVRFPLILLRIDVKLDDLASAVKNVPIASHLLAFVQIVWPLRFAFFVQDAWIRKYATAATDHAILRLDIGDTFIELPATFRLSRNAKRSTAESAAQTLAEIRRTMLHTKAALLIAGESGIGKSTYAGNVIRLATSKTREERIWRSHIAYPFVVPRTFDGAGITTSDQFVKLISDDMESIARGDRAPLPFVEQMLATKRILIVADGLSEMPAEGFAVLKTFLIEKDVAAFVATSRSDSALSARDPGIAEPTRLRGSFVRDFASRYAASRGFGLEGSFLNVLCDELESFAGASTTALMVTMYIDLRSTEKQVSNVPPSVPEFMKMYVRHVNGHIESNREDNESVVLNAERLAHRCCVVSGTYRSSICRTEDAMASVANRVDAIDYLADRLKIIERLEPGRSRLRFSIDTLCEYLAASFLVEASRRARGFPELRILDDNESLAAFRAFKKRLAECIADIDDVQVRTALADELSQLGRGRLEN